MLVIARIYVLSPRTLTNQCQPQAPTLAGIHLPELRFHIAKSLSVTSTSYAVPTTHRSSLQPVIGSDEVSYSYPQKTADWASRQASHFGRHAVSRDEPSRSTWFATAFDGLLDLEEGIDLALYLGVYQKLGAYVENAVLTFRNGRARYRGQYRGVHATARGAAEERPAA